MLGFIGSYDHNMDAKNRLFVPAKFRDGLTGSFVIKALASKYPCIQCFRREDFEKQVESAAAQIANPHKRRLQMFAEYAGATDVNVDGQGRIAIPASIASLAKLEKETVIVGMGDHIEIWDPAVFKEYYEVVNRHSMDEEAAAMSEEAIALERTAKGEFLPTP